jgi:hypothetical protein
MKYSIRGRMNGTEGETIAPVLQSYTAWRLMMDNLWGENVFTFEIWLASEVGRVNLFEELKPFVDEFSGVIDWHECTHDERYKEPCIITEEYRR